MKKTMLIALLACTVVAACSKKSDDKVTDPNPDNNGPVKKGATYQSSEAIYAEQAVMYTNNGVITDQAVIKEYLTRKEYAAEFTFETAGKANVGRYTLKLEENGALIGPDQKVEYAVNNDSLLLLADVTSLTPNNKAGIKDTIYNLINAFGPVAECKGFYTTPCPYKEKYPIQIKSGKMYIPYMLAYVAVTYNQYVFGSLIPVTTYSYYSGEKALVNGKAIQEKLENNTTITYYDSVYEREFTTPRYDTTVVQVLKRELIKQ